MFPFLSFFFLTQDKEYYGRMFCVERVAMFFLAMRHYTSWGCLLWSLGLALFGCSYASDLSNKGLLSHKDLMRTTINNDPRLNPRLVSFSIMGFF